MTSKFPSISHMLELFKSGQLQQSVSRIHITVKDIWGSTGNTLCLWVPRNTWDGVLLSINLLLKI